MRIESAVVAQWIERLRPKEGVGGSIPSDGVPALLRDGSICFGEMSEWFKVRLSKSRGPKQPRGFESHSLRWLTAKLAVWERRLLMV